METKIMYIIRWNDCGLEDLVSEDIGILKRIVKAVYPNSIEEEDDGEEDAFVFVEGLKERAWVHEVSGVEESSIDFVIKQLKKDRKQSEKE